MGGKRHKVRRLTVSPGVQVRKSKFYAGVILVAVIRRLQAMAGQMDGILESGGA